MSIYDDMVRENLSQEDPRASLTTFGENLQAGLGLFIDENLSVSQAIHYTGVPFVSEGLTGERNRMIIQAKQNGDIPEEVWDYYTAHKLHGYKVDFEGLSLYMQNALGRDDILTHTQLFDNLRDELKTRRDYAEGVFENQTGLGAAGELLGTMWGAALDPVNAAGVFAVGGRAYAGYSALQKVAVAGVTNMATEAVIQPSVYAWKQAIQSEYSTGDAVANIIAAGAMGSTVEGVAQGLKAMIVGGYKTAGAGSTDIPTPGQQSAVGDIEAARAGLDPLIREVEQAPHPNMDAKLHVNMVDEHDLSMNGRSRVPDEYDPVAMAEIDDSELDAAFDQMMRDNPDLAIDDGLSGQTRVSDVIAKMNDGEARMAGLLECLRA